ncbi:hypothetical protein [Loktanella sp. Alg231-35]|uniref:hypothetical protein n=1 Tax=Loktanella sp. Alg231-35 TaxID=1922220 RepID=UPI000D556ED3|nr:hypothetical protein [Loktanella sp. Alg231-35]
MARKKKKSSFWDLKLGFKNLGGHLVQTGKELSSIPAYAARELTGQSHHKQVKAKLKKGWFE